MKGRYPRSFPLRVCLHRHENQHFLSACAFSDAAVNREYFNHFIFNMNFRLPCRRHRILEILFTSHFDYYRVKGQFFYRSSKKKSSKYRNGIYKIKINISQVTTNKIFEFVVKPVYKIRSENCLVRKSIRLTNFGTESTTNYAVKLCHAIPPENQTCFFSHGL